MPDRNIQTTSNIIGLLDNYLQAKNAERASYVAPTDFAGGVQEQLDLQQQLNPDLGVDFSKVESIIPSISSKGESDVVLKEINRLINDKRAQNILDAKSKSDAEALAKKNAGLKDKLSGELDVYERVYGDKFQTVRNALDLVDTDAEVKALREEMTSIAKGSKKKAPSSKGELVNVRLPDGSVKNMREADAPVGSEIIGKTGTAKTQSAKLESELSNLKNRYNSLSIIRDPSNGKVSRSAPSLDLFPAEKRHRLFELELMLDKNRAPKDKKVRRDANNNLIIVGESKDLFIPQEELNTYLLKRQQETQ